VVRLLPATLASDLSVFIQYGQKDITHALLLYVLMLRTRHPAIPAVPMLTISTEYDGLRPPASRASAPVHGVKLVHHKTFQAEVL